jgi:2-succinyl-6-hydroxy-2,4-cyclohexadiene-1-carboxylate synthase
MIHALHGNFGLPSDWDAALPDGAPAKAWHLWEIRRHHPEARTLTGFATWFNQQIAAMPDERPRILAGYSLGGRLALHVLLDRPALWQHAVILSTHPGLDSDRERAERLQQDRAWLERCRGDGGEFDRARGGQNVRPPQAAETWASICAAWQAQPVLQNQPSAWNPAALEPWREEISSAFDGWSLGWQENLLPELHSLPLSGHWITGADDLKFSTLAHQATAKLPQFKLHLLRGAGHRLLATQPEAVKFSLEVLFRQPLVP